LYQARVARNLVRRALMTLRFEVVVTAFVRATVRHALTCAVLNCALNRGRERCLRSLVSCGTRDNEGRLGETGI